MFKLTSQTATLDHLSLYTEKHGDENVKGIALKFVVMLPSKILDLFTVGLREAFYSKGASLRFSDIGPIKWKRQIVGATVGIKASDLFGDRDLKFDLATCDKFILDPLEGGTVAVTMRCKVKPDADSMSILYELLNQDVAITIDPAKAEVKAEGSEDQPELAGVDE